MTTVAFAAVPAPVSAEGDVKDILARVVERAGARRQAAGRYEFTRTKATTFYKSTTEVESHDEKIYRATVDGKRTRARLISWNGRAITNRAEAARASGNARARGDRTSGGDSVLKQLNDDVLKRFDFALEGKETVGGRLAWIVSVRARPGAPLRTIEDEVMARMAGKVWVDTTEYEVAKVEMRLLRSVKIGWGGMLGALRDFQMLVERTRIAEIGWVNARTDLRIDFRALLQSKRIRFNETITNVVALPPVSPPTSRPAGRIAAESERPTDVELQ
ncbi:MAG TPA: hypothetical protein VJS65_16975 [Verrucomicrobiae bacterium]|nr:hypothetical protein [Verrucomicrobiae bacterium]